MATPGAAYVCLGFGDSASYDGEEGRAEEFEPCDQWCAMNGCHHSDDDLARVWEKPKGDPDSQDSASYDGKEDDDG